MKALLCLALLVTFAGCTSDPTYEIPEQDSFGRYVIEMLPSNRFSPAFAEVPEGSIVYYKNLGGEHNAVLSQGDDTVFLSGLPNGNSISVDLAAEEIGPGDYELVCQPHASIGMKGGLRVIAA